jgi:FkbM family methyltransferase
MCKLDFLKEVPLVRTFARWRIHSMMCGMRYGETLHDRITLLRDILEHDDKCSYWLGTPFGRFRCPDAARALQFGTKHEIKVRQIVSSLKRGNFIDIGAIIGFYSALTASNENHLIAVEPSKIAFDSLSDNLRKRRLNASLVNAAAWSECGRVNLVCHGNTDTSRVGANGFCTKALIVDRILNNTHVDLVKIDVEGGESHVLMVMEKTLSSSKVSIRSKFERKISCLCSNLEKVQL